MLRLPIAFKFIRRLARRLSICSAALFSVTAQATSIEGFVTQVGSSTDFYLSALHVVIDGKTQCATEDLNTGITWKFKPNASPFDRSIRFLGLDDRPEPKSRKTVPCASAPLAIGCRVQIAGDSAGPDGSLIAVLVKFYIVKIKYLFVPASMGPEWSGGALLEEPAQVSRTEKGWVGTIWLNGYPMTVTASTELLTAPSGTRLSYRPPGSHVDFRMAIAPLVPTLKSSRWGANMPKGSGPAFTESLFQANTWAVYRGGGTANGHVSLEGIRLWSNEFDEEEKNYLMGLTPVIHYSDKAGVAPDAVGFEGEGKAKSVAILASQSVQEYVTGFGASLVPEYQRKLSEQDKTKVHFRFYVVRGERPLQSDEMATFEGIGGWSQARLGAGAVAFPDGLILVPDYMLARIRNQAQLATILSDAITVVLQKQGYIGRNERSDLGGEKDFGNPYPYDASLIFPLLRNEQTLRIGIRQMYLAGYDIREAPIAWAAAAGKPTNPFPAMKKNSDVIPWYTAYSFDYISCFYSDVDYSKVKRGEKEYATFLEELRKADPEAFVGAK